VAADAPDPGPGSGRSASAAHPASFLPGPVPDRTVWEGWNRWRLTRRDFVPAPVISAGEHARMTPSSGACMTCTGWPPIPTC
jgi:hypothetical protein